MMLVKQPANLAAFADGQQLVASRGEFPAKAATSPPLLAQETYERNANCWTVMVECKRKDVVKLSPWVRIQFGCIQ